MTVIEQREYNGSLINQIDYKDLTDFINEERTRPYTERPAKMTAIEIFKYIMDNHLEGEYLKIFNKMYDRFGRVGAPLVGLVTLYIYFDKEVKA